MTIEEICSRLHYDQDTGVFVWKTGKCAGKVAGTIHPKQGYRIIHLRVRERCTAHRLAWFYVHGEMPSCEEIDHINGDRTDNRIANLRLATRSQNKANSKLNVRNLSGFKGVSFYKGAWVAQICHQKKRTHLGRFKSPEEAHASYVKAAKELFGEFANDGAFK